MDLIKFSLFFFSSHFTSTNKFVSLVGPEVGNLDAFYRPIFTLPSPATHTSLNIPFLHEGKGILVFGFKKWRRILVIWVSVIRFINQYRTKRWEGLHIHLHCQLKERKSIRWYFVTMRRTEVRQDTKVL